MAKTKKKPARRAEASNEQVSRNHRSRTAKKSRRDEPEYDNTDRGVLFKNRRKTKDSQPDYTGQINIGGEEFWLSMWLNESKAGQKFFALRVNPKDELEHETDELDEEDEDADDLPF